MAKNAYVGVNGVARHIKGIWVGVNGVARKVKAAWVGVNGVARQFYATDWWIPSGYNKSNIIAAWRFKGVASQASANVDLTGNGHTINYYSSSTWSSANGYYVNDWLYAANMGSINAVVGIFAYSGLPSSGMTWFSAEGSSVCHMAARVGAFNRLVNGSWTSTTINYPGFVFNYDTNWSAITGYRGNSAAPTSGVLAFDRSYPAIYINGNSTGVTYFNVGSSQKPNNMPWGTNTGLARIGGGSQCNTYIKAAVFYASKLTSAQHKEIATNMASL